MVGGGYETGQLITIYCCSHSTLNWSAKNGIDCGAIAAGLVMVLRAQGLTYNAYPKVQLPHLECAHTIRERMLHDLSDGVLNSYHLWMAAVRRGDRYSQEPSEDIRQILDEGPDKYYGTTRIEQSLASELLNCLACKSTRIPLDQNEDSHDKGSG